MVNYLNGKIYKLVNNVDDKIYVGSTCGTLRLRKNKHKHWSKIKPAYVHTHLNKVGWCNVDIILIEAYECKNKDELHRRERYWYDELKPALNMVRPIAFKEDIKEDRKTYYQQNKDEINIINNQWALDNREKSNLIKKNWSDKNKELINTKINCECGGKYSKRHKSTHEKTKKHTNFINSQ